MCDLSKKFLVGGWVGGVDSDFSVQPRPKLHNTFFHQNSQSHTLPPITITILLLLTLLLPPSQLSPWKFLAKFKSGEGGLVRGWSGYDMIVQRVGILRPCFLSMENQVIEDPREKNEVPAPPTHTYPPCKWWKNKCLFSFYNIFWISSRLLE